MSIPGRIFPVMFLAKINKKEGGELRRTRSLFKKKMLKHSNSFITRYKTEAIRPEQIISHQIELSSSVFPLDLLTPIQILISLEGHKEHF